MIKKPITSLAGLALFAACVIPLSAQFQLPNDLVVLHNWEFNEDAGTELSGVVDSVQGAQFAQGITNSATTGDGVFRVGVDGSPYAGYAPMSLPTSGTLYLGVDLAAWNANTAGASQARFGFQNDANPAYAGSAAHLITEMSFERHVDHVELALFATGTGGSSLGRMTVADLPVASSDPVRLVMEYDLDALESRLYYSIAGSAFTQYSPGGNDTALVSSERSGDGVGPHHLRLSFFGTGSYESGAFGDGQSIDIDGVFVAVPEPSTYALFAGIGILGLAIWRRRRS